ncbi:MAG: hypothetical protein DKT66_27460 [Candidatus Melainabacteria bacterium]|nr:MAG: hypothetical protein DKT66_27460 [Candidatus Melainabacteria bacterium]
MTRLSNKFVLCGITAGSMLLGVLPAPSIAQVKQQSSPPAAPSFLKQAGQMILNNAQKNVLHGVNQTIQQGQSPAQPTAGTYSSDPTSLLYNQTSSTPRQAAPCRSWVNPNEKPIAAILCIHGLGLQSNSYEYFGTEQSKKGIAVYAIDVRGFGSWMKAGGKGKVNFDDCLADIKQTCESIRAANPGIPVYVLGESMGGAIALRAASMYPDLIDGLISAVPAGERFNQGKTSMKVFLNLLSGFNVANVGQDIVNQATQNAKLKSQWQGDPLSKLNLSPQELIQFQDFMNMNHEAAKKVTDMPVLFVQGNGDQLVKPEGTWELFNDVAAKDKSFFAVPGEHLIFEEAQTQDPGPRDQNFRVISSWLTAKVGRRHGRRPMGTAMNPGSGGQYGGGFGGGGFGAGQGATGGYGAGPRVPINTAGLEQQVQLIDSGNTAAAISQLESLRAQRPDDANVIGLLGQAYMKGGQPDLAGRMFRRAMRMNRGGDQSKAFNTYLLGLGNSWLGNTPTAALPSFSKGRVYAFYANWADQCKTMNDALTRLFITYGDRVDFQRIDVDAPGSDALVEQFKVGPIPTVVFVSPSGQVSSTIIGESTSANYESAIKAIAR